MAETPEPEGAPEQPIFDTGATGVALALEAAKSDPASREDAAAFLEAQRGLIDLQKDHLKEQFKQLKLRTAGDAIKLVLQGLSLAAILGLIGLLGVMVRDAMNANGLVVAGFSSPPAFAAHGLTGEALGNDLTSRIAALVRYTNANSLTRSDDVRGGAVEAVKLDIPETGVSLGEVDRFLRGRLGHERRLTADLRDEGDGMASITISVAGADPVAVRGSAADIDGLMNAAAEKAFAQFDPTNAIIYLAQKGRQAEVIDLARQFALTSSTPRERAIAYAMWSLADPDRARALRKAELAIQTDPTLISGWFEATNSSSSQGHDEAVLTFAKGGQKVRRQDQDRTLQGAYEVMITFLRMQAGLVVGDYAQPGLRAQWNHNPAITMNFMAQLQALLHDSVGANQLMESSQVAFGGGMAPNLVLEVRWATAAGGGDWPAALASASALVQLADQDPPPGMPVFFRLRTVELPLKYRPWLALAKAKTGDVAGAQALAAMGPLDCYLCVRVRGQVAEAAGDRAGADRWFAEAVRQGPSLPFAQLEWGQAKLARGDRAGAVAEFSKAHALSPRFADPLEAWGEALAAGGDASGALGNYADADRIAPKWGRLHLKWGEALAKLGRADDARAQFRSAAGLYLSGPDRAELAAQRL